MVPKIIHDWIHKKKIKVLIVNHIITLFVDNSLCSLWLCSPKRTLISQMFYYQPSDETTGFVLWWPNSVDWYSTKLQPRSGAFPLKVGGKREKPWERGCLNYWKSTVAKTKLNIIINFLSSGFYHLQGSCHLSFAFSISIFLSAFYHPHFIICILSSAFLIIRILQSPSAFSRVTFCGRCAQARMERDRSVRFRMS